MLSGGDLPLVVDSPEEVQTRFRALTSPEEVAELLGMSYARLAYYVYRLDEDQRYRTFEIKKRAGGVRTISEPMRTLKIAQRQLADVLHSIYVPKPSVHGFVTERSVATNAQVHARKRYVLNVDIEAFFPSINFGRVRGLFLKFPYQCAPAVATFIARICCFRNALPQGAPTSPIIANMIAARMDSSLQYLAKKYRCNYTRYADDITFSSTSIVFPSALAYRDRMTGLVVVGADLDRTITGNGFRLNPVKTRLQRAQSRQEVTGLVVNRFPNVPRQFVRQIRAMLHAWERFGIGDASREFFSRYDTKDRGGFERDGSFSAVVKGKIDYLSMIRGRDDPIVQRFLQIYAQLEPSYAVRPNPGPRANHVEGVRDALWVLESDKALKQGTAFTLQGYGVITCAHVLGPATKAFRAENPTQLFSLRVLATSAALDLAIINIEGPTGHELRKGRTARLAVGSKIVVAGYPNFRLGDSGWVSSGSVAGFRTVSTVRRILVDTPIIAGCSGGPVLDAQNRVVGVAVTGADRMEHADGTEHHGVIPIETIDTLRSLV